MPAPSLKKKVGPLPVWAWIAAIAFVLILAWYIRRRSLLTPAAQPTEDQGVPEGADLSGGLGAGGVGGGAGGGNFVGPPIPNGTGTFDPGSLSIDYSAITEALQASLDAQAAQFAAALGAMAPTYPTIYDGPGYPTQPTTTPQPQPAPAPRPAPAPTTAPPRQTSFSWGGLTWGPGDKARFIQWLNAHGASYSLWVIRHPKAAHDVFGESVPGYVG